MSERRAEAVLDRRKLVVGATGTLAAAGLAKSVAWPSAGSAANSHGARGGVPPAPNPIPGGLPVPPAPGGIIHTFLPGPTNVTLPFTGLQLMGLDVEPSTITDFRGSTASAYVIGTATGSDGATYNMEADIRAFEGEYVAGGSSQRGAFAFV